MTFQTRHNVFRAGLLAAIVAAMSGCAASDPDRVVSVKGGFQQLPGATGGLYRGAPLPGGGDSDWDDFLAGMSGEEGTAADQLAVDDPVAAANLETSLRRVNEDQSVTLISRAPRHVIYHLLQTLRGREVDLLFNQVLSEHARQGLIDQGRDPWEAVDYLARNQQQIEKFLSLIPFGEQTPGVIMQPIGRNMFRIEVDQARMTGTKFSRIDVIIESGSFRLLNIS